jgi:DNA invertase Pin-like site-specific DNA recombinase
VEANVLKKPFSKSEVEQMVNESLSDKTPEALQSEMLEMMQAFMLKRAEREEKDIEEYIRERIKNIPKEEKYGKIPPQARQQYINSRTEELENSKAERIANMEKKLENEVKFIHSFFSAVKVGQSLSY